MRPDREQCPFILPIHAADYAKAPRSRKGWWTGAGVAPMFRRMTESALARTDLPQRALAVAIVFVALGALRLVFDHYGGVPAVEAPWLRVWFLAGYLTVLTTVLVAGAMTAVAMKWRMAGWQAASLLVSVLMVGSIYHLFLAGALNPQGLHWWGTQGMHTGLPILVTLWWVLYAPKDISPAQAPLFIAWPVLYTAYALARGALTGFWPYPFMDVPTLGLVRVLANLVAIGLVFTGVGLGVALLARRLR